MAMTAALRSWPLFHVQVFNNLLDQGSPAVLLRQAPRWRHNP